MDTDTTTDWRGMSANLANAAHRLRLAVVNLALDPSVPELVRRSPAFVAAVRDAELVEAFLERWREAERNANADLVVVVGVPVGFATVAWTGADVKRWLLNRSGRFFMVTPDAGVVTVHVNDVDDLVRDAEADGLTVVFGGEA
jgi:hypothetical protein